MSSTNASIARGLRTLIRACADDERTLEHERKFVDAGRAASLTRFAHERQRFISDLEKLAAPGRDHRHSGSWAELLREAGRNVWVTAAGRNNGDAITVCRHSRARTEMHYDEALQRPWPDELRRVIEAQRHRLHDETDELNQLLFYRPRSIDSTS